MAPLAERVGAAGFLASDGRTNLAGAAKARALVERFGEGGFDYVGNERRDLAVWRRARRIVGVGLPARLAREVRALDPEARLLPGASGAPRDVLRAWRCSSRRRDGVVRDPRRPRYGRKVMADIGLAGMSPASVGLNASARARS